MFECNKEKFLGLKLIENNDMVFLRLVLVTGILFLRSRV